MRNGEEIKAKLSPITVNNESVGYLWLEDNLATGRIFFPGPYPAPLSMAW
jgi:hypothetical protein